MDENPYASPAIVATKPTLPHRAEPGVGKAMLAAVLLPLPVIGGLVGLVFGFFVAMRCFSVDRGPPMPDLSDFGRTFTLLSGVSGFAITAVFITLAIRK